MGLQYTYSLSPTVPVPPSPFALDIRTLVEKEKSGSLQGSLRRVLSNLPATCLCWYISRSRVSLSQPAVLSASLPVCLCVGLAVGQCLLKTYHAIAFPLFFFEAQLG